MIKVFSLTLKHGVKFILHLARFFLQLEVILSQIIGVFLTLKHEVKFIHHLARFFLQLKVAHVTIYKRCHKMFPRHFPEAKKAQHENNNGSNHKWRIIIALRNTSYKPSLSPNVNHDYSNGTTSIISLNRNYNTTTEIYKHPFNDMFIYNHKPCTTKIWERPSFLSFSSFMIFSYPFYMRLWFLGLLKRQKFSPV